MAKKSKSEVQVAIDAVDNLGPKLLMLAIKRQEVPRLVDAVNMLNEIRILLASLE